MLPARPANQRNDGAAMLSIPTQRTK